MAGSLIHGSGAPLNREEQRASVTTDGNSKVSIATIKRMAKDVRRAPNVCGMIRDGKVGPSACNEWMDPGKEGTSA